jgi:ABC-type xylose transport system substrate-binding protein
MPWQALLYAPWPVSQSGDIAVTGQDADLDAGQRIVEGPS